MVLIRPRLNDHYNLPFTQEEVDFAIPLLDEDIPLHLDPFLLWKSPSLQDNSLHTSIVNSFNHIGYLVEKGEEDRAIEILIQASECDEVGLGTSKRRIGKPIGQTVAKDILSVFKVLPHVRTAGFIHFEEIQLYVNNLSTDRISDFACNFIKSFLIDYTIEQCIKHQIPIKESHINLYDYKSYSFIEEDCELPFNPEDGRPIIFVPKRWLRAIPWINYNDYDLHYFGQNIQKVGEKKPDRIAILNFNRHNYDVVQAYIKIKEAQAGDCKNDPLFKPISVISTKRKVDKLLALPTGRIQGSDKVYEETVSQLLASLLYPKLDFADTQTRTDSGVLIRDLIFYNNRSYDFLKDIYDDYGSRQLVFEFKNVTELQSEHINQINRYLKDEFGRFGVIVTRNPPPRKITKNLIDLWSGQRRCIIVLDDQDLKMMGELYESKQRLPIDVVKKKYIEFARKCPS